MALFAPDRTDPRIKTLGAEYADLVTMAGDRISRQKLYREENALARQKADRASRVAGESDDYGFRNRNRGSEKFRHSIPLPLGKALTVKHSYRISGQLPDCVVDRRDESPTERYRSDTMEKIVWAIIRASRGQTEIATGAWDGSEIGATAFDMYWDFEKQIPLFRACDPVGVVEVQGAADPHDFERVYRSWDVPLSSLIAEYSGKLVDSLDPASAMVRVDALKHSHLLGDVKMVTVVQMSDKNDSIRFVPNCDVELYRYHHGHGFAPYVIIPNIGPYRDVWGWSDYEFVRSLVAYIGQLFGREADILRAVSNGAYVDKASGQNADNINRVLSEGGVLPIKATGDISPIQAPEVPGFEAEHAGRAMEMFKMLGFAPDASWGNGAFGSGSDRGLALQPLVEYTAMKQMNWEAGLGRLFSMAYRMIETKLVGDARYRGSMRGGGNRALPFSVDLSTTSGPAIAAPASDSLGFDDADFAELPRNPKDLFDGDHDVRFVWNNRIDPDDPAYVLSELNKFKGGAQSLETTLERLGFEAPQDEMKRIEAEAERFPWINQGMVALIRAQLSQGNQGDGGGQPADPSAIAGDAASMAAGPQGHALGADAAGAGLGAAGIGTPYGGA